MLTAQLVTVLSGAWTATIGRDQRIAVSAMYVLAFPGFMLCLYGRESDLLVGAILLGLGQGGTFSIGAFMIILRAHDAGVALRLNGMTQLVGYSIASLGPWIFGMAHDASSTWNFALPLFTLITFVGMAAGVYVGSNRSMKSFN